MYIVNYNKHNCFLSCTACELNSKNSLIFFFFLVTLDTNLLKKIFGMGKIKPIKILKTFCQEFFNKFWLHESKKLMVILFLRILKILTPTETHDKELVKFNSDW